MCPPFLCATHRLLRTNTHCRFDEDKIIAFLERHRISQVYVIGGDGTHRGAYRLATAVAARQLNTTVCGVPKTIDNDVGLIDYRSLFVF